MLAHIAAITPLQNQQGWDMQVFFVIAYFIVGFVQIFAIADGVGHAFGVGGFASFILAAFLTYIPIVGAGFGVYGAVTVWGWPIWQAIVLFFWYLLAGVVVSIVQAVVGR